MSGGVPQGASRDGAADSSRLNRHRVWDDQSIAALRDMMQRGYSFSDAARHFKTTRNAVAGKCRKLGIKAHSRRTAAQALSEFAEALSHHGDIARAGAEIGVGEGQAKNLFTELRKALGRQAR